MSPPSGIGDLDPAPGNQLPTANANGPYNGTVNEPVVFSSSGSTDPDGSIVMYAWDFGDGGTSTDPNPSHTYTTADTFTVSLTVTDDASESDTATTTAVIAVGNQPPVADAAGPYRGLVGQSISFDGSGSSDPDGSIASYAWDFGDGNSGTGATPNHAYASAGTFNVTLTVTDDANATDSATATATITAQPVNQLPTADAGGPYTGTAGVAVSFDGSGSNDPDGSIVSYDWDFGDGNTGTGVSPSHTYGAGGGYTVSLTVTDNENATASASASVNIASGAGTVNEPPTADPAGPYSGTVGVPVSFDGSNSSDPDGTIIGWEWDFGDGIGTSTDASPTYAYTSDGTFVVTLTVTDNEDAIGTETTTAEIGTGNLPPIADAGGPYDGMAGEPVVFDGRGSSDPDGSIVSYDWDFGDGSTGTGVTAEHTYAIGGFYNVTLEVTDGNGATDSDQAVAAIAEPAAGGGGDVSLLRLITPRVINLRDGETGVRSVTVIAAGSGVSQGAAISLTVSNPAGVTVEIPQSSASLPVSSDDGNGRYRLMPAVTCETQGLFTLTWTASVATGGDTLTDTTEVRCMAQGGGGRKGGGREEDDEEDDEESDD